MATTDTRAGFRLPWSAERPASREATAEPAEPTTDTTTTDLDLGAPGAPGSAEATTQERTRDAVAGPEDDPMTIVAAGTNAEAARAERPAGRPTEPETSASPDGIAQPGAPEPAGNSAPTRRPTKFLADLTRAMQVATEQARTATLEQLRADGTVVIEQVHARSATGAAELRQRADDDVASIKDWSKAELARIREETEQRVGSRREQLEGQLERHAALVEHESEKVRGSIAAFEVQMTAFFDELLREEDPALFAARAANLPEPPSFEPFDDDALAALLLEPGIGTPGPAAPEPGVAGTAEAASEPSAGEPAPTAPFDREAAMVAIQAAAEAAAAAEIADGAFAPEPDHEPVAQVDPPEAAADATPAAAPENEPAQGEPEIDPRLVSLGLGGALETDEPAAGAAEAATESAEAAEAAAASEAAEAGLDEVSEIGGDQLAARLSGLVPADPPAPAGETVSTRVVTTGLVSVASIASFKRHLGRLAGVVHVGVSSGPDGEFVFAVDHDAATSLRELIPTIPGFGARVVGSEDGIVRVSAQDPQD